MTLCQACVIVNSAPASASQRSASRLPIASTTVQRMLSTDPTYSRDDAAQLASASALQLRRQPHIQPNGLAEQLAQAALHHLRCRRAVLFAHIQMRDDPVRRLLDQY